MPVKTFTREDLTRAMDEAYKGKLGLAIAKLTFVRPMVASQPGTEDGVKAFVKHHLGLIGEEAVKAVHRIMKEEIRTDVRIDKDEDEVSSVESYGVNVIRRNKEGIAYVATHMVRACLKVAASRMGIFVSKRGSKGDLSEALIVRPIEESDMGGNFEICIMGPDGKPFSERIFERFSGAPQTKSGKVSIQHDSEIAPIGSWIKLSVQWPTIKVGAQLMAGIFKRAESCGLGGARSLEYGQFEVSELQISTPDKSTLTGEDIAKRNYVKPL